MSNPQRTLASLALFAASAMLSACSPPRIEVEVQGGGASAIITMTQDWGWIFPMRKAPCIRDVSLYRGVDEGRDPVWAAAARGVQCIDLGSFVIGTTPKGFEQVTPLPPNARGWHYLVVHGIGRGETALEL